MHGLGNDYLFVYGDVPDDIEDICRRLSDRHFGAGSDGMIYISPSGKADLVRAMIVEAGSGSAVGNAPIHAGPTGRSVWGNDVSGQHPSRAKSEYLLPAEFNQKGNQFVENAMRIMETAYGDITEFVFATVPDSVYYGNVQVSSR